MEKEVYLNLMGVIFGNKPFLHICECCGKREILTAREAFEQGWDYPGEGGLFPESTFGTVGPRTCGTCPITETLWWQLTMKKMMIHELSNHYRETLVRILNEPGVYDLENITES